MVSEKPNRNATITMRTYIICVFELIKYFHYKTNRIRIFEFNFFFFEEKKIMNFFKYQNVVFFADSTVESNVKPNQRSKWMVWSIASIVLLSTIFGALVGAHLTMIFMKDTNVESGITGKLNENLIL